MTSSFNVARAQRPHGLLGTGAQDGHLDFTQLLSSECHHQNDGTVTSSFNVALRPQRPYGLLRTGGDSASLTLFYFLRDRTETVLRTGGDSASLTLFYVHRDRTETVLKTGGDSASLMLFYAHRDRNYG